MKNKVLNYTTILLVIISLIVFIFVKEKVFDSVKKTKTMQIKSSIKVDTYAQNYKPYLYDNSKSVKEILPELLEEAQNNDAEAAYRVVELSSICGIANAAVTQDELDNFLVSLGESMLSDSSGRVFFNQLLTFPGISVDSFNDFSDIVTNGMNYCKGYEAAKDEYSKIFHFLNIAAKNGNAEAMVFLWKMSLPGFIQAKAKHFKNPNNLDYLEFFQDNKNWQLTRIDYLYEAARAGEEKAWVLLGDMLSSDELVTPNFLEAYKYYYASSKYYEFPFLKNKLAVLENYLTENEINIGKADGEYLFSQFN